MTLKNLISKIDVFPCDSIFYFTDAGQGVPHTLVQLYEKMKYKKTLDWIKEVRKGCKQVLERDAQQILKIMKKGSFETETLYPLLMEIRDTEKEDALLCLIEEMLKEDKR